jgi:alcohol dehydrogenase
MADIVYKLDPRIIVGVDTINRIGSICGALGNRVLIAAERALYENRAVDRLSAILEDSGVEAIIFDEIPAQATADVAENAAVLARGARCGAVIGFGGIKIQSAAKLAAIMAGSGQDVFGLLDGGRNGDSFIPYVAVPTTGRDPFLFTDFFIAVDPRDRSVKQVKTPPGLCTAVVIDNSLSESLSEKFTATTVFDGFCVSVEAYCSLKANFFSDAFLEQAVSLYSRMIHSYTENYSFDLAAGTSNAGLLMAMGSSLSAPGIGTALAYALNGRFPVAKSWCSTVLLPYIMEKLAAARPEKLAKLAAVMGEPVENVPPAEAAGMALEAIRRYMGVLQVPARLKEFDLILDRLVPVADAARNLEFIAFSPWTVTAEEAYDILKQAF